MVSKKIDEWVTQANEAADRGDWQAAISFLSEAEKESPEDSGILSGLGSCLLQTGRAQEAVRYFIRVVELESQSADVYCNLGMAYTATGQYPESEKAFLKALELQPTHLLTRKNLAVLYVKQENRIQEGLQLLVALLKENPKDIESVLMLASFYLLAKMYDPAEKLCQHALRLQPGNSIALGIQKQIEAAVQLQKESASPEKLGEDLKQIARPEHAKKLLALKNLSPKKGPSKTISTDENIAPEMSLSTAIPSSLSSGFKNVCFYGGQEFAVALRFLPFAKSLEGEGIKVKYSEKVALSDHYEFDTFVFGRPHLEQTWIDTFFAAVEAKKRVIIDIDEDFHNLPEDHPGYALIGPGNPTKLQVLERMLAKADLVTVSSKVLVERYGPYTKKIKYLPSTWDKAVDWWIKPAPKQRTFNVGWCDYASEIPNLYLLRRDVSKFIKETDNALLVIGGDLRAVEFFNNVLPEEKMLFLPFTGYEHYPFMLAYFDVLLSPIKESTYNFAKPDTRLLEAGVRGVPWIASRIPSYDEWGAGGLFAEKTGDWYSLLRRLYDNATLREELGTKGKSKAGQREVQALSSEIKLIICNAE
jgi:tetratricopeptide (TPR) repeat protein